MNIKIALRPVIKFSLEMARATELAMLQTLKDTGCINYKGNKN